MKTKVAFNVKRASMKCKACGGLSRVSAGLFPDKPCPFCRTFIASLIYKVKLFFWERGLLSSRFFR